MRYMPGKRCPQVSIAIISDHAHCHTPFNTYHGHILEHSGRFCSKSPDSVLLGCRGGICGCTAAVTSISTTFSAAAATAATATFAALYSTTAGRLVRIDVGDALQSPQHDTAARGTRPLLGYPVSDTCLAAVVSAWKYTQLAHLRSYGGADRHGQGPGESGAGREVRIAGRVKS